MEFNVNWTAVSTLVASLFVAQIAGGLIEGLFLPIGSFGLLMGLMLSFVLGFAVFAIFAFRRRDRPVLHAVIDLGTYIGIGLVLSGIFGPRIQSFSRSIAAIQWTVLASSMGLGVSAGCALRWVPGSSSNA
ncbi:hypothetical protein [Arenimonas malthae]|uniref:hypothetical protein n=1 Tax=Arenimonas malthae TaxID=354197 RepID=UPI0012EB2462|nr:hypothetical protein [Arenimonas malthae]